MRVMTWNTWWRFGDRWPDREAPVAVVVPTPLPPEPEPAEHPDQVGGARRWDS